MNAILSSSDKYLNLKGAIKLKGLQASTTITDGIFRYIYVNAIATNITQPTLLTFDSFISQYPKVKIANNTDRNILGIAITSLTNGENRLITKGIIEDTTLTPAGVGQKVYCDASGHLTYTPGVISVGIVIDTQKVFINIPRSFDELNIAQLPSPDDPLATASQVLRKLTYEYQLIDIMYNNKQFITGNGKILVSATGYSEDNGITWLPYITPPVFNSNPVQCIYVEEKGIFVAPSFVPTEGITFTTDGKNWETALTPDGSWSKVAYGNGTFVSVAISGGSGLAIISVDGINWISKTVSDDDFNGQDIAFGNNTFVMVVLEVVSGLVKNYYSTDNGQTWQLGTLAPNFSSIYKRIVFGNGIFMAFGYDTLLGEVITTSTDGITWTTPVVLPAAVAGHYYDSLGFSFGKFYAGIRRSSGTMANHLYVSDDNGATWAAVTTTYNNAISYTAINTANDILFAIGDEGFSRTIPL